jgi:hypothetical protein
MEMQFQVDQRQLASGLQCVLQFVAGIPPDTKFQVGSDQIIAFIRSIMMTQTPTPRARSRSPKRAAFLYRPAQATQRRQDTAAAGQPPRTVVHVVCPSCGASSGSEESD